MGGAFRPSETLVIRQEAERVTVTDANDRQQVLVPDGQPKEEDTPMGVVRTQTEWKKKKLVSQREREGGRIITRTFALGRGGDRLTVETEISGGGRQDFSVKHVYDRAAEAAPQEPPPG